MQNKITQMFVILLQMALLLGGWGAAQAVVFDGGGNHTVAVKSDSSLWAWGAMDLLPNRLASVLEQCPLV